MNDKDKKLLSKVFSKEELLEIIVEVLKEDRKIYSNSRKLRDFVLSSLDKKEKELFKEHGELMNKLGKVEPLSKEFFKLFNKQKKIKEKFELIWECNRIFINEE
ncbi:hypothetical protein [Clostridium sp.]|uniref:hypothetical protein n=1 Tax=Clostridium sp. TaxID=1506 RepID=UPI002900CABD|nr:hypothetical protein [Clostridium sp.]MDU2158439.1 hypothetical protein [Clostridium sp.]